MCLPTRTRRTNQAVGVLVSRPSLEMPKRILEGGTEQERAKMRKQLGSLKGLTVQPSTRKRYDKAVDGFLQFLKSENLHLPTDRRRLDPLVCDYLEHLWSGWRVTRWPAYRTFSLDCVTICRQPGGSCEHGSTMKYQAERRPYLSMSCRRWPDGQFLITTMPLHFHC